MSCAYHSVTSSDDGPCFVLIDQVQLVAADWTSHTQVVHQLTSQQFDSPNSVHKRMSRLTAAYESEFDRWSLPAQEDMTQNVKNLGHPIGDARVCDSPSFCVPATQHIR